MRRLRRIVLNAATVLSLLLSMATLALWIASGWIYLSVNHVAVDQANPTWLITEFAASSGYGELRFARVRTWYHTPTARLALGQISDPGGWHFRQHKVDDDLIDRPRAFLRNLKFRYLTDTRAMPMYGRDEDMSLYVPYWFPFLVGAFLPGLRLWRRSRRPLGARRNLCPACGYDLRATPDRCPECGRRATA
jgi:hypothetical protein